MSETAPSPQAPDSQDKAVQRRLSICEAAFGVFAQYGVKRTSMQDIARAAGMSRPALYQHFRSKEDIARHLVGLYFDEAAEAVEAALSQEGRPGEILEAAFRAKAGPRLEVVLDAPHGAELLEMGNASAADLVAAGEARLRGLFADWLWREATAGRITFNAPAGDMAATLLAALDGVKRPPFSAFEAHLKRLARLFGRGLEPKTPD